jgi:hypothetical protein
LDVHASTHHWFVKTRWPRCATVHRHSTTDVASDASTLHNQMDDNCRYTLLDNAIVYWDGLCNNLVSEGKIKVRYEHVVLDILIY